MAYLAPNDLAKISG